jgi:hypothetical protein
LAFDFGFQCIDARIEVAYRAYEVLSGRFELVEPLSDRPARRGLSLLRVSNKRQERLRKSIGQGTEA